jgi:hypothetical protein
MKATRTRMTARRRSKPLPPTPPAQVDVDIHTPPVFGIADEQRQPEADASVQDALEEWPGSADAPDEWMVERDRVPEE